jgi:hypothetical protein
MAMYDTMGSRSEQASPDDPKELSSEEARQGVTGFGVRYVLAFSLGGALVALVVAWLVIAT